MLCRGSAKGLGNCHLESSVSLMSVVSLEEWGEQRDWSDSKGRGKMSKWRQSVYRLQWSFAIKEKQLNGREVYSVHKKWFFNESKCSKTLGRKSREEWPLEFLVTVCDSQWKLESVLSLCPLSIPERRRTSPVGQG